MKEEEEEKWKENQWIQGLDFKNIEKEVTPSPTWTYQIANCEFHSVSFYLISIIFWSIIQQPLNQQGCVLFLFHLKRIFCQKL